MLGTRRSLLAALAICGCLSTVAHAVTYVKVADEWGTIQAAGPRTGNNGIRGWNIEGFGAGPTFASSGTLRFYMADLVTQLNAAFPTGWQVNKVTLVAEHDDAAFTLAGNVSIFHVTNDTIAFTSGGTTAATGDAAPNDFTALGVSPLQFSDTATWGGQAVRVQLAGGVDPALGTITKLNDYTFTAQGDGNLDVFGNPADLVDPAGATNATPDYTMSFPTINVDDTLATFTTEVATDNGDWSAGGQSTIISDIQSGTDALSFIFAATDAGSTVAATYKGGPFATTNLYPPRIYLDVTAAAGPVGVNGDYNGNGVVDAADYVLWRNGGPLQNDATAGVQPADYDLWRSRFGATSGSGSSLGGSAAVPEPASAVLLLFAIAAFGLRRRTA